MLPRRDFLRLASLGAIAACWPSRLHAEPAGMMDGLLARLKTAESAGVIYLHDPLRLGAPPTSALTVHTQLADPAHCGRRRDGWAVSGGVPDSYTWAVLRDSPVLGNRSQLAQFSFRSTQTGVARGEHGLVEMRLCRGTTPDDLPLRIRVEHGAFYILGLNGDTLLAGDRETRVFAPSAGTVYTLTVLLFQKAVFARLGGADVPGGAVELVIPDRRRFVPGRPGFGLRSNAQATGGELAIFNWSVMPVGPATNCRLGAIGDSLTAGNDQEPEDESYVHLATRALGQELVLNTGSGGSTAALDLARLPYEISPFRPKFVWIEGGSNDLSAGVAAGEIFQNMMRQAELVSWGGLAVFSTIVPRPLPTEEMQAQLGQLNRLIRESGRPFVDRHALMGDPADPRRLRPEFSQPDGIHVTRLGHALIAREAARLFRSLSA